jgi:hypothetical protein
MYPVVFARNRSRSVLGRVVDWAYTIDGEEGVVVQLMEHNYRRESPGGCDLSMVNGLRPDLKFRDIVP